MPGHSVRMGLITVACLCALAGCGESGGETNTVAVTSPTTALTATSTTSTATTSTPTTSTPTTTTSTTSTPTTTTPIRPVGEPTACDASVDDAQLGLLYVSNVKVRGISCPEGYALIEAFHDCRMKAGDPKGRCTSPVHGYACRERRPASDRSSVQYIGYVTCTRGSMSVSHSYSGRTA